MAGGYQIRQQNIRVLENPKVAHGIVIDLVVIIVIKMARNSRENGPTDININLGACIEELVSLGKNMSSRGICYLDKLEHRIAQKG